MKTLSETVTRTPQETERLAQTLASEVDSHEVIALYGDLGMGKTVFSRAFIRTLAENNELEIPSPTFTLLQTYSSTKGHISHFDCYRLTDPEEIYELGWEDAISEGITLIEWPQRIQALLPSRRLDITLSAVQNSTEHRHIKIIRVE